MPGITGLITRMPREQAEAELRQMVATLRHEPFYVTGTWIDETLGIYIGWTARKGSFSDGMPLRSERGDIILIFSGDEHSAPGTRSRLRERGHSFDPDGPSYLVHLCEQEADFPAGLNGLFHGLMIDRQLGRATLFNDRYGMHRICYHESKQAFYFAAEAKAILAVRPELRRLDSKSLGEFIALSCVLEDRSMFEEIRALPAGSAWTFKNGAIEKRSTYFQPRKWEEQEPLDPENYYLSLRKVFSQNLPRYFNGSEQSAVALTGGLDTRAIMAWKKAEPGSLPCYTFGSMLGETQDVILARQVAEWCGQTHRQITVGKEFLSKFRHYAARSMYLTEGSVDVSRSPDLFLSERAREVAPAKIVGTYGSEIVRQSVMFKPDLRVLGPFAPEVVHSVRDATATYSKVRQSHPVTFAAFRQSPWYHHGILALEQSQLSVRSPYLDNDFVRTVYRAPRNTNANGDVRLRLIADGDMTLRRMRTDRGLAGNHSALSRAITHQYLEFTFKAEYAYDYGMPQWVARIDHLFSPLQLERHFLGRHKHVHFRVWYRDALAGYVREMLLDPRTLSRPYLDGKTLERMVNGHLKGDHNYTTAIHKVLALELIHRTLVDA